MKPTTLALVAAAGILATQTASAEVLYVDFQHDGGVDATGYTIASSGLGILAGFTDPTVALPGGYTLEFTGDYTTFAGDQADNPVDEDGWELTGAQVGTFTLTGLNVGDTVSIYATNAWDDFGVLNAIVNQISFGGGPLVDVLAGNYPGTPDAGGVSDTSTANDLFGDSQDTDFFTTIATDVVATGASISGTIDSSATAGQFGAFIIEITPVPEPGSLALAGLALACVACRRR